MFTADGIMDLSVMDGAWVIGMVVGMPDTGVASDLGDSITGIILTGVTAVIGATTLIGDGATPTTILGFTTVQDGATMVITALGIIITTDTPLSQTAVDQIKTDILLEAAQIVQIWAQENNLVCVDAAAMN